MGYTARGGHLCYDNGLFVLSPVSLIVQLPLMGFSVAANQYGASSIKSWHATPKFCFDTLLFFIIQTHSFLHQNSSNLGIIALSPYEYSYFAVDAFKKRKNRGFLAILSDFRSNSSKIDQNRSNLMSYRISSLFKQKRMFGDVQINVPE